VPCSACHYQLSLAVAGIPAVVAAAAAAAAAVVVVVFCTVAAGQGAAGPAIAAVGAVLPRRAPFAALLGHVVAAVVRGADAVPYV